MPRERVERWLRSVSSWAVGRDGTFVDDLETLADRGVVEDYEVRMTDGHVPVAPEDATSEKGTSQCRTNWTNWPAVTRRTTAAARRPSQWPTDPFVDRPTTRGSRAVPGGCGSASVRRPVLAVFDAQQ